MTSETSANVLRRHDKRGFVRPSITFETKVEVQKDDPYLVETHREVKRRRKEIDASALHRTRIPPYIAAKRAGNKSNRRMSPTEQLLTFESARDAGEKIPTLAEFEARSDSEEEPPG